VKDWLIKVKAADWIRDRVLNSQRLPTGPKSNFCFYIFLLIIWRPFDRLWPCALAFLVVFSTDPPVWERPTNFTIFLQKTIEKFVTFSIHFYLFYSFLVFYLVKFQFIFFSFTKSSKYLVGNFGQKLSLPLIFFSFFYDRTFPLFCIWCYLYV